MFQLLHMVPMTVWSLGFGPLNPMLARSESRDPEALVSNLSRLTTLD